MTTLLGKRIQPAQVVETRRMPHLLRAALWGYASLALVIGSLALSHPASVQQIAIAIRTPATYTTAAPRLFADFGKNSFVAADAAPLCSLSSIPDFNSNTIFPILPSDILSGSLCSPPYWNLTIFKILAYKALGLLNYIIGVAALILTIYAGLLYLSGFANEKNVATAKTVLISTYTGLVISLAATLILRSTITVFADKSTTDSISNQESTIFQNK